MTQDEIKAYTEQMIALANIPGHDFAELRTRIVQQVIAVCGMPFNSADAREEAMRKGAGPRPFSAKVN